MNIIENPSSDFEREFVRAINERRKLKGNKPKFVITSNQVLSSNNQDDNTKQIILTVKSIQTFVLGCIEKNPFAYSANWCKILRVQKLQQTLVIVLNGVKNENYNQLKDTEDFQGWKQMFTSDNKCHTFRFHTQSNISFLEQFSKTAAKLKSTNQSQDRSLLRAKAEQISNKKHSIDNENETCSKIFKKSCEDQFSRIDLVLSLKQLIIGNYPCPIYNEFKNFKQTKSSYQPITSSSQIFALDVETFDDANNKRQIPYWISIVNEQLNCIYQVLIKPNNKDLINIYQKLREEVIQIIPDIIERTLEEVHNDLEILFPDDLILAGHSIENDLKYLQIYHPYIIDTAIIFNITGTRLEKSSLQKLYANFFGRIIQKIRHHHDPTEDARATMELVQLKLSKNIEFGDWFLGGVDQLTVLGRYDTLQLDENIEQCQKFLSQTKIGLQEDFFQQIKQKDKALIIDQVLYNSQTCLPTIQVNSNRDAFKTCIEQIPTHEFLWLQIDYLSLNKMNKYLKKLYKILREDSIIIGILFGEENFSQCFVRIKDDENLTPLIIQGEQYPHDLKLIKTK